MSRDSRTAGQGRALHLDARPAEGQSDFLGTCAERAQAEAVAANGNSLAHQSHPRVEGGGGKVSWGKAPKGPEAGSPCGRAVRRPRSGSPLTRRGSSTSPTEQG